MSCQILLVKPQLSVLFVSAAVSTRHRTVLLASVLLWLLAWPTSASAQASNAELRNDELLTTTSARPVQQQPAGSNSLQRGEDPGGTEDQAARQEAAPLALEGSGEPPAAVEDQQMSEVSADRTRKAGGGVRSGDCEGWGEDTMIQVQLKWLDRSRSGDTNGGNV